jgi:cobyrinic acid a,c-diamide synthase
MSREKILGSFHRHTAGRHVAVIEGNRGLYDGVDPEGRFSTAELAKALQAPVIVIVDATKMTRTAAAMVLGLRELDRGVDIRGVVLNKVGGARHESILRGSIEQLAGVRVVGAIPRFEGLNFPERHLGLVPVQEHGPRQDVIHQIERMVRDHVEVDTIRQIADQASELAPVCLHQGKAHDDLKAQFRVGVIRDEAFHFYYPENLEALVARGARIVMLSALEARHVPDVDALYIGGGFPEMWAEELAQNTSLLRQLRELIEAGLPVYAECGGLMYLGRSLKLRGKAYPMVGALPLISEFDERPQGHGYTTLLTIKRNPFFQEGTLLKGHEFHYSRIISLDDGEVTFAFRVLRGNGIDGKREGIVRKNVLATYTHLHALGCQVWGDGMALCARGWRELRQQKDTVPFLGISESLRN